MRHSMCNVYEKAWLRGEWDLMDVHFGSSLDGWSSTEIAENRFCNVFWILSDYVCWNHSGIPLQITQETFFWEFLQNFLWNNVEEFLKIFLWVLAEMSSVTHLKDFSAFFSMFRFDEFFWKYSRNLLESFLTTGEVHSPISIIILNVELSLLFWKNISKEIIALNHI